MRSSAQKCSWTLMLLVEAPARKSFSSFVSSPASGAGAGWLGEGKRARQDRRKASVLRRREVANFWHRGFTATERRRYSRNFLNPAKRVRASQGQDDARSSVRGPAAVEGAGVHDCGGD